MLLARDQPSLELDSETQTERLSKTETSFLEQITKTTIIIIINAMIPPSRYNPHPNYCEHKNNQNPPGGEDQGKDITKMINFNIFF